MCIRDRYYAHMRTINQENFVSGKYKEWALKLQNLVEPAVLIDSNFLSTYGNFKVALETNTPGTNGAPTSPGIFPLKMCIRDRYTCCLCILFTI